MNGASLPSSCLQAVVPSPLIWATSSLFLSHADQARRQVGLSARAPTHARAHTRTHTDLQQGSVGDRPRVKRRLLPHLLPAALLQGPDDRALPAPVLISPPPTGSPTPVYPPIALSVLLIASLSIITAASRPRLFIILVPPCVCVCVVVRFARLCKASDQLTVVFAVCESLRPADMRPGELAATAAAAAVLPGHVWRPDCYLGQACGSVITVRLRECSQSK